jgi:hypothetical protein
MTVLRVLGKVDFAAKTRAPHCDNIEDWLRCFPFNNQSQVAYEIDNQRSRFVDLCAHQILMLMRSILWPMNSP